jgi:hypothetical protein
VYRSSADLDFAAPDEINLGVLASNGPLHEAALEALRHAVPAIAGKAAR